MRIGGAMAMAILICIFLEAAALKVPGFAYFAPQLVPPLSGPLSVGIPCRGLPGRVLTARSGFCRGKHRPRVVPVAGSLPAFFAGVDGKRTGTQLCMSSNRAPSSSPEPGSVLPAATFFRGGGENPPPPASDAAIDSTGSSVDQIRGGGDKGISDRKRLLLDKVEDVCEAIENGLMMVGIPLFHLLRLGFGISLLFYGMAFRTFAFHIIVFRLAGLRQVQKSFGTLRSKYRAARQSIRAAAEAAETLGERVASGDSLQAARERMIAEKKRLMANGYLSTEETSYFMKKYKKDLEKIIEEQERFKSARSSIFSVRKSVDPKEARASIAGLYNALVASFTASTIQTAGQITLGLHMGSLLKTHILDLFGPILDPIGYRLDLNTYYDKEDIPYMGKANAMDGPSNLLMNIICYSTVFIVFRVHPSIALKASMVYYGARIVTDYVIVATEPVRRKFGQMTIIHTPWTAVIHIILTAVGFYFHRSVLSTKGVLGLHPFAVGPGAVGLVEPFVRLIAKASSIMQHIDFFKVRFVQDPVELVMEIARKGR